MYTASGPWLFPLQSGSALSHGAARAPSQIVLHCTTTSVPSCAVWRAVLTSREQPRGVEAGHGSPPALLGSFSPSLTLPRHPPAVSAYFLAWRNSREGEVLSDWPQQSWWYGVCVCMRTRVSVCLSVCRALLSSPGTGWLALILIYQGQ
jgi:hypothetical protein